MEDRIPQQAKELNHKRAQRRTWHKVLAAAACVVVFCTTYALILPAITMEKTAYCGYEAHTHSEACYTRTLICGQEEDAQPHQHTDACYQTEDVLICPLPEGGHVHDESCYDEQGQLICQQEEGHIHTAECYQARPALVCGMEETSAAHVHTDVCYEELLTCELPEHEHTLSCYSDHEADIETADIWERSVSAVERSDTWAEDVIAIAQSQLGCRESDKNYIVTETGAQKGITRYGQWYGDAYGDWCAMFVSFCLHYGGVPEEAVSHESSCPRWQTALTEQKLFRDAAQQTPQAGDIVFFDLDADGEADHVGLVESLEEATRLVGEEEEAYQILHTIEGNNGDSVQRHTYDLPDDETVLGYVPLELAEHSLYQCGLLSHRHGGDCTGADGTATCGKKEHVHDDSCLTPRTGDLTYEDDQIIMHLHVEGENVLPEDTRMEVTAVDAGDKDYQPFADYTDSRSVSVDGQEEDVAAYAADDQSDTAQMIVRGVTLLSGGQVLDTTGYTLTAEVEVKPAVIEPMLAELAAVEDAAPEAELGVVFTVLRQTDEQQVEAVDSVLMQTEDAVPTLTVPVSNGVVALEVGTPDPHYTVQYYAYIPRFAESGDKELTVIDTSGANGLPTNDGTPATKMLHLKKTGEKTGKNAGDATDIYRVATENTLTKIYKSGLYEYVKAPNPSYVNKLIDNPNYTLSAVWVLKDSANSENATSTDEEYWDVYGADIHFTNRKEGANLENNVIYIADNAVIRLVYDATSANFTTSANFYDYDISSGQNPDGKWRTGITGINQENNYGTSGNGQRTWRSYCDVLAFGNANCGTGMANYKFGGVYLNKHSGKNYGCTFGLANRLENGKIVYNEWVVAPKLFNDGTANGKQTYENSSLTFSQVGDTYTLSAAKVNGLDKGIDGLQDFFNPSPSRGVVYDGREYTYKDTNGASKTANRPVIFTNDFWPLDEATNKTDPKFGAYSGDPTKYQGFASADGINGNWTAESEEFPVSDDGNDHNSFFGMQYAVEFTLTEDYVGPLEYYFFGDDDMWVFLDDKLVCDIGGVHSSVGEYVDLWDYLQKGTEGKHTLTFFYTERGASGSTCYMNFTLPSVSGINLEQKSGELRIQKKVVGDTDAAKAFDFQIHLSDANGKAISDDYSYSKYGSNNEEIETDLVAHDGSKFTLCDGEYIIIKYLPFGLRYTVTETPSDGYTTSSTVNGVLQAGYEAKGTIIRNASNTVLFTNTVGKVGLKLQKLDADGTTPLTDAIFQLRSGGDAVKFVKKADGSYAATTQTTDTIDTNKLYYIALASNTDYVVGQAANDTQYKAQLQQKNGADSQQVEVFKQDDGSYSFRLKSDGRWLDLHEGKLENYQMIHFYENADTPTTHENQKWFLTPNGSGFYIQPRKAVINKIDSVMDLSGGTVAEGTYIQLYEKNKTAAQRWLLVPVETDVPPGGITTDLTVDGSGVLQLSELMPGSYTLVETESPADHKILDKEISLTVDKDGVVRLAEGSSDLVSVEKSGSGLVLKVRNRPVDKQLTLKKEVSGSSTTQEFQFTVSYTRAGLASGEQTVTLGNDENTTIDIPRGATVTITEVAYDGFTVSFDGGSTELRPNEDGSVTFTMMDNVTITATNTAGYALPETGGSGAALYLALGLLLMGGSALALGLRRRREAG